MSTESAAGDPGHDKDVLDTLLGTRAIQDGLVTPDQLSAPVGPDLDQHYEALKAYADAGVDELFVQQIGPEQDLFFAEWAPEILQRF